MEVALRDMGLDPGMVSTIFDFFEDSGGGTGDEKAPHHPTRAFIRDAKAMKNTPADVIELPNAYHFVIDMPGLRSDQIKVQIEDDSVLVVSGERRGRPEKEEAGSKDVIKYLRMERRLGKLLKKFALPENADKEKVSGNLENGVLTVVVQKSPPPEAKKPKVIEVKVCGGGGAVSGGGEEVKAGDRHESDASHGDGTACK